MKRIKTNIAAIAVTGVLSGSALTALADAAPGKPFDGLVVSGAVVLERLPSEVQKGSIAVKGDTEEAMAAKARVSPWQAAEITRRALPGQVIGVRLTRENGYLIWEAMVIGRNEQAANLKIDAGNGRLLANEWGGEEEQEAAEGRERG